MGIFASLRSPWREQMAQARFRGAEFFVKSHNTGVGRKVVEHDFPNQDDPWWEDLGRKGRRIKVDAYVIQSADNRYDYFLDRDKLLTALEEKGPGQLVHPWANNYFGVLNVVVESAEFTETLDQGGIAHFAITFATTQEVAPLIPSPDPTFLEDLNNAITDAMNSALGALDAASEALMLDTAQAFMRTISGAITQVKGAVSGTISVATGYVSSLLVNLGNVINAPCDLANSLIGGAEAFGGLVGLGEDVITGGIVGGCSGVIRNPFEMNGTSVDRSLGRSVALAALGAAGFNTSDDASGASPPNPVVGSGEQAEQSALAQSAIQHCGAAAILGSVVEIAQIIDYSSANDATDMIERVAAGFDAELERLGSANFAGADDLFQQLEETRARALARLKLISAALPQELDYTPPAEAETTLVLAYRKYNELDSAEDIELRNRPVIRHPGFLPARTLRILAEVKA